MTSADHVHPRLGRRFAGHDPRNLDYLARPLLAARRAPAGDVYWPMPTKPISYPLDQGDSPECTGYGSAHEFALGPVEIPGMDAAAAHARYLRNQAEDRAMGNNFPGGGATVLATMKAAQKDQLVSGYVWCKGVDDVRAAVRTTGPVCLGTEWFTDMFTPTSQGLLRVSGQSEGGHFYVVAAHVQAHPVFGPGFWMVNSWGRWGVAVAQLGLSTGCAFVREADLARLLAQDGEAALARDYFEVAPTPGPTPGPAPEPVPDPKTAPFFATDAAGHGKFHRRLHAWLTARVGFDTRDQALAAGYRPCRVCRP